MMKNLSILVVISGTRFMLHCEPLAESQYSFWNNQKKIQYSPTLQVMFIYEVLRGKINTIINADECEGNVSIEGHIHFYIGSL